MIDLLITLAAFSAFSAILVASGYGLRILHVNYRVKQTIQFRTGRVRDAHASQIVQKSQVMAEEIKALTMKMNEERKALERERAELARMKGLQA